MSWVKAALNTIDVRPSKSRGQNFLESTYEVDRLISDAKIEKEDTVIEIGPGLGALTSILLEKSKKLYCIEIESKFIGYLKNKYINQLITPEFILSDFREVKVDNNLFGNPNNLVILSNLPYVFSTDAINWLIENRTCFKSCSLLVQKEFAERMSAKPNSKIYGSITVHCQFYFDVVIGIEISGNSFFPTTEVSSRQIHLYPKKELPKLNSPISFFENVVRSSFAMRRKKLLNCLCAEFTELSKVEIEKILKNVGFIPNIRAENLSLNDFCKLSDELYHLIHIKLIDN